MLNKLDIVSVAPVSRIAAVLAVEPVASLIQALGDRANQLVKGQEYSAQVLSKAGESSYKVKVEGKGLAKDLVLKMELANAAQAGQTLLLRYLHDAPTPTFQLLSNTHTSAGNEAGSAKISPAAQLIVHILNQAESEGVSTRFEATSIVTQAPNNPQIIAHDLKHAVSTSGLFYESHLGDLLQNNQSLTAIRQEPQNQANTPLAGLVSQQLAILESQRMSWQSEVWPGQTMDWNVYLPQKDDDKSESAYQQSTEKHKPIASEMTLHLPQLGKVSARISIIDGHMRIGILAEQTQTLDTLKNQRLSLAKAIESSGQQLDRLTIAHHAE
ncbi:MAG: flagellar hook-length control protein FliK [Methylotenera sp.]